MTGMKPSECPDISVGAMPLRGRSGLLRATTLCGVVAVPEPAAIAIGSREGLPGERQSSPNGGHTSRQRRAAGPSESFLNLTRKPSLKSPERFEPTVKGEHDVVI